MLLGLSGIMPNYLHVEPARGSIELQGLDGAPDDALQSMKLWARQKQFTQVFPLEYPAHSCGILLSPEVSEPRENPAGMIHSDRLQQLLPELRERIDVVHHETPAVQAQEPGCELHQLAQPEFFCFHGVSLCTTTIPECNRLLDCPGFNKSLRLSLENGYGEFNCLAWILQIFK